MEDTKLSGWPQTFERQCMCFGLCSYRNPNTLLSLLFRWTRPSNIASICANTPHRTKTTNHNISQPIWNQETQMKMFSYAPTKCKRHNPMQRAWLGGRNKEQDEWERQMFDREPPCAVKDTLFFIIARLLVFIMLNSVSLPRCPRVTDCGGLGFLLINTDLVCIDSVVLNSLCNL